MAIDYTLVRQVPLATAACWYLIGVWSVTRRRWGSETELFFFLFCGLLATWALLDWFFLNSTDLGLAVLISQARNVVMTLALFFGLLFGRRLAHRRGWVDLLLLIPLAAALVLSGAFVTSGAVMEAWGPRPIRDEFYYGLWVIWGLGSGVAMAWYVYLGVHPILRTDPGLARKMKVILGGWILTLCLGLGTNIFIGITASAAYPAFSAVLIIPALLIIFFFVPMSRGSIAHMSRRLATPEGSLQGVYLFDRQGTVLGAAGAALDEPAGGRLGGILRSMEEFVRKSLDEGPRGRLKSLKQEGFTIVVESGSSLVLAALLDGEPHDLLRGELREVVSMLEQQPGAPKPSGSDVHRVLEALLRPREVF